MRCFPIYFAFIFLFLLCNAASATQIHLELTLSTGDIGYLSYNQFETSVIVYGDGLQDGLLSGPDRQLGTSDDVYIAPFVDRAATPYMHVFSEIELLCVSDNLLSPSTYYDSSQSYWGLKHYTSEVTNSYIDWQTEPISWHDLTASSNLHTGLGIHLYSGEQTSYTCITSFSELPIPVPEPCTTTMLLLGCFFLPYIKKRH